MQSTDYKYLFYISVSSDDDIQDVEVKALRCLK